MLPVIKELAGQGLTVSIDTMHAEVAQAALENGAQIVNDVSGGRADPNMARVVADAKVPWVLMHWRSVSAARPHDVPPYRDVVAEVRAELLAAVDAAVHAGVDPANLIIDPGLGFAKTGEHNWALLRALPEFVDTGIPVLVGASRKRFLGTLLADADGEPRPPGRPRNRNRSDLRTSRSTRCVGRSCPRCAGIGRRAEGRRRMDGSGARWLTESSCAA